MSIQFMSIGVSVVIQSKIMIVTTLDLRNGLALI